MAPTTRPKPQLTTQAMAEEKATSITPCCGVRASEARRLIALCTGSELAIAWPVTRISAICMVKASRFQKPPPHMRTISSGPAGVSQTPSPKVISVSRMAKTSGSGR